MNVSSDGDLSRVVNPVLVPPVGTFEIDPVHTFAGFSAQHLVVGRVRGRFKSVRGTVTVAEDPSASTVEVSVETASISTLNATRDDDLRSERYLDVERALPDDDLPECSDRRADRGRLAGDGRPGGARRESAGRADCSCRWRCDRPLRQRPYRLPRPGLHRAARLRTDLRTGQRGRRPSGRQGRRFGHRRRGDQTAATFPGRRSENLSPTSKDEQTMAEEQVAANLKGMDDLDFVGWNNVDWSGVFAHHHTEDVLVDWKGQPPTHGIGEHIDAMKAYVESSGGTRRKSPPTRSRSDPGSGPVSSGSSKVADAWSPSRSGSMARSPRNTSGPRFRRPEPDVDQAAASRSDPLRVTDSGLRTALPSRCERATALLRRMPELVGVRAAAAQGTPAARVRCAAAAQIDYGLQCRLYVTDAGLQAMPSTEWIRTGLAQTTAHRQG